MVGLLFIITAAVVGFISWLLGVVNPRDVAVIAGFVLGGLWSCGVFLLKMINIYEVISANLTKQRISQIK